MEDCSLYTCESELGAEKEGWPFIPKGGDCNMCICRDGKPADCTQYDCGLQHPGCTDKHGIMYRHGQYSTVRYSTVTI